MIKFIRKALPALAVYMSKNGGINTVTAATATGIIPALLVILESPSVQQGIESLGQTGQTGALVAAGIVFVRTVLGILRLRK
jgi:hypothetical protein